MNFNHLKPETITAYLAQELPAHEKYNADSHLAVCPECAAKIGRQRHEREKIAKAFQRSPGRGMILSSADLSVIDGEIRDGIAADSASGRVWNTRIRRSLLIQVFSILLAAGVLALLLLLPRPEKQAPAVPEPPKAEIAEGVPAEEIQESAVPETPPAEPPQEMKFQQNRDLIEKLGLEQIPTVPAGEAETLVRLSSSAVRFPFAPDLCVVYADAVPGKGVSVSLEIVPPAERQTVVSLRPGGAPNAQALLIDDPDGETVLPPLKLSLRCVTENGSVRETYLPLPVKIADYSEAEARVRLAVLLHAVSDPALLLRKNSRMDILQRFDELLEGEYRDREDVRRLAERLRRIK